MERRDFLKYAGFATASSTIPLLTPEILFAAQNNRQNRIVVLVELKGGNDGFNTLVPFTDKLYYKYRPRIAIKERQVLKLNKEVGLHPRMKALMPLWKAKQMAWVQGVGYPRPVLSHFRSMDIWDSASNSNQFTYPSYGSPIFWVTKGYVVLNNASFPIVGEGDQEPNDTDDNSTTIRTYIQI